MISTVCVSHAADPFISGYWDCFYLWAIANNSAASIGIQISDWILAFSSFGYRPRRTIFWGFLGHMVILCLIFWGSLVTCKCWFYYAPWRGCFALCLRDDVSFTDVFCTVRRTLILEMIEKEMIYPIFMAFSKLLPFYIYRDIWQAH